MVGVLVHVSWTSEWTVGSMWQWFSDPHETKQTNKQHAEKNTRHIPQQTLTKGIPARRRKQGKKVKRTQNVVLLPGSDEIKAEWFIYTYITQAIEDAILEISTAV